PRGRRVRVLGGTDPGDVLAADLGQRVAARVRVRGDVYLPTEELGVEVARAGRILAGKIDPGRRVGNKRFGVWHMTDLLNSGVPPGPFSVALPLPPILPAPGQGLQKESMSHAERSC